MVPVPDTIKSQLRGTEGNRGAGCFIGNIALLNLERKHLGFLSGSQLTSLNGLSQPNLAITEHLKSSMKHISHFVGGTKFREIRNCTYIFKFPQNRRNLQKKEICYYILEIRQLISTSSIFSFMLICLLRELILLDLSTFLSFSLLSLDFLSWTSDLPVSWSRVTGTGWYGCIW